jgi:hypothetical protein
VPVEGFSPNWTICRRDTPEELVRAASDSFSMELPTSGREIAIVLSPLLASRPEKHVQTHLDSLHQLLRLLPRHLDCCLRPPGLVSCKQRSSLDALSRRIRKGRITDSAPLSR